jgi:GNAT superfamily N-acetyltransferase
MARGATERRGLSNEVSIRAATLGDVDAIAEIHVAGYEYTYRDLVPDRVIDIRTPELRRRVWAERLSQERPREFVLVAEIDDRVSGFSSGRPALSEEWAGADERVGFWENLYLVPAFVGTGIGFALQEATLNALRENGFEFAVGYVTDGNVQGMRFLKAGGWRPDGVTRVTEGILQHRITRGLGVSRADATGVGVEAR